MYVIAGINPLNFSFGVHYCSFFSIGGGGGCNCSVAPPSYRSGFNEQHPQPYLLISPTVSGRPLAAPKNVQNSPPPPPATFIHNILSTSASFVYNLSIFCPFFCPFFVYILSTFVVSAPFCPLFVHLFSIFCPLLVHFLSTFCPFHLNFCPLFVQGPYFVRFCLFSICSCPNVVHFLPFFIHFIHVVRFFPLFVYFASPLLLVFLIFCLYFVFHLSTFCPLSVFFVHFCPFFIHLFSKFCPLFYPCFVHFLSTFCLSFIHFNLFAHIVPTLVFPGHFC